MKEEASSLRNKPYVSNGERNLKINEIDVFPLKIPFKRSARIASYEYPYIESILVRVKTSNNIIGYGEAVTDPVFTGETVESITNAIKNYLGPAVLGLNPFCATAVSYKMDEVLVRNTAAKTAIDMACLDVVGKTTKQPVYNLLGGEFNSEIFEVPEIVLGPLKEVITRCKEAVANGVKCLKVKVGEGVDEDVEKVKSIRDAVGADIEIRLDANQGWRNYWTALKVIKRIERYDISLIEQPLPTDDLRGTAKIRKAVDTRIMLDESIHSVNDALAAIQLDACDLISVKTMKAGGLLRTKELVDLCWAHGIPCHMGTSWETEVGWAANLHLIKALPNIRIWDAYPPTEVYWGAAKSIATPIKSFLNKRGTRIVKIPSGPGLGITVNEDAITQNLISDPISISLPTI